MSDKFKLKEGEVVVRDQKVVVRELKHRERTVVFKTEDKYALPSIVIAMGALDPVFTEEEASELPGEVSNAIYAKILEVSGMVSKQQAKDAEGTAEKESDAG